MRKISSRCILKYDKEKNAYVTIETDFEDTGKNYLRRLICKLLACWSILFENKQDYLIYERLYHDFFRHVEKRETIYYLKDSK